LTRLRCLSAKKGQTKRRVLLFQWKETTWGAEAETLFFGSAEKKSVGVCGLVLVMANIIANFTFRFLVFLNGTDE